MAPSSSDQMLISERYTVGGAPLWRYIARAAVVARLDSLCEVLRAEDEHSGEEADDLEAETKCGNTLRVPVERPGAGLQHSLSPDTPAATSDGQGLEEREKELIRMKIERLEGCKGIIEREHALQGGGGGGSGGGGGGGSGGGGGVRWVDRVGGTREMEDTSQRVPVDVGGIFVLRFICPCDLLEDRFFRRRTLAVYCPDPGLNQSA